MIKKLVESKMCAAPCTCWSCKSGLENIEGKVKNLTVKVGQVVKEQEDQGGNTEG